MAPKNRSINDTAAGLDPTATMMAALLPLHTAVTPEWLVDAAATACERALNAAFSFVLFQEGDLLEYRGPASDVRRRSIQRATDALGEPFRRKLKASVLPSLAAALETGQPTQEPLADFFSPLLGKEPARTAQIRLGVEFAAATPLDCAGQRVGALVVLSHRPVAEQHLKLLGEHIAAAAVNLRQSSAVREQAVMVDVARSVFDARKLETELQRELTRSTRYKREVSIVVIEATNLRLLTERFGEFLVQRFVQRLGEALAQHSRDIDVIGAYKDSGYVMVLSEAGAEGAGLAAQRLLAHAQEVELDGDRVPGLELHLAAGHASSPADGTTTDALYAAAERRMYDSPSTQVA